MNVLKDDHSKVEAKQKERMNFFWGDESWMEAGYHVPSQDLFGNVVFHPREKGNIVSAFKERLKTVAGFKYVPDPMPMRNSTNAIVYWLFFASPKPVAASIVEDIFSKYQKAS